MSQYFQTAERMLQSSKILHENNQFFNACYLAGYVVECYQKIVIQILDSNPKMIHDLDELKEHYKRLKATRRGQRLVKDSLAVDIEAKFPSVFQLWNPTHRYDDTHKWDEESSLKLQKEIKQCNHILARMRTNGYIKP